MIQSCIRQTFYLRCPFHCACPFPICFLGKGVRTMVFKIIRNLSFNSYVTTLVCDPLWASEPAGALWTQWCPEQSLSQLVWGGAPAVSGINTPQTTVLCSQRWEPLVSERKTNWVIAAFGQRRLKWMDCPCHWYSWTLLKVNSTGFNTDQYFDTYLSTKWLQNCDQTPDKKIYTPRKEHRIQSEIKKYVPFNQVAKKISFNLSGVQSAICPNQWLNMERGNNQNLLRMKWERYRESVRFKAKSQLLAGRSMDTPTDRAEGTRGQERA